VELAMKAFQRLSEIRLGIQFQGLLVATVAQ
jgi:hypothetical protein